MPWISGAERSDAGQWVACAGGWLAAGPFAGSCALSNSGSRYIKRDGAVTVIFSRIATILVSVVLVSACGSAKVGHDFDVDLFASKIEQGVTTQDQVRSWLGEPTGVGVSVATSGERFNVWNYYFVHGKWHDLTTAKLKVLQVKFDKAGTVRSYDWSTSR
jgi:hypothetical protein